MKALFFSLILACGLLTAKAAEEISIDKITSAYLGVKDALIGSNAILAKSKAADLLSALTAQPKNLDPKQQKLLVTYLEKLKYDSRHISETTVLDHQREHFASLSKNMYALLSGLKMNKTTLYQEYCPMKKSYWLSESTEIRNPYYGEHMMECGKVTATLKPAAK